MNNGERSFMYEEKTCNIQILQSFFNKLNNNFFWKAPKRYAGFPGSVYNICVL